MAVGGAGKQELACRMGWTYGNFLKRLMTLGWAFIGVFAAFLYPGLGAESREMAFGIAVMNLLPAGLIGLMLASMAAAVMSSCDSFMVGGSALFTRNFYNKYVNPDADDKKQMLVARLASVGIVIGGIAFALVLPSVVDGLLYIWKFTAFFGVSFWMALFWRRTNRYGTWASLVAMIVCNILTDGHFAWAWDLSLPMQILIYLPVGFLTIIIVSLFTPAEDEERLRQFYLLLNTPVGEEYKLKEQNVDVVLAGEGIEQRDKLAPSLQENGHSLLLVDLLKLHKTFSFKRYRIDVVGFVFASAVVAAIFGLGVFAASIGAV
jgi:Na+/proline symporter